MDPRLETISERLAGIKNIIAVAGCKGGIGKSSIASVLALTLAKKGHKTGLFDLDFYGPSGHIILGIDTGFPKEEKGIIPPEKDGLKFMSIACYTKDNPAPLRGEDVSNAIIELLTITQWKDLDFLIIDMPPGLGDATLDMLRIIKDIRFLLVTTPSKLAQEAVKKLIGLLQDQRAKITGIVENMNTDTVSLSSVLDIPVIKTVDFDPELDKVTGNSRRILKTYFAKQIGELVERIQNG